MPTIFMACRAIHMIAFHVVESIFICLCYIQCMRYIHMYIVKEVVSFRGLGQLMGMVCRKNAFSDSIAYSSQA